MPRSRSRCAGREEGRGAVGAVDVEPDAPRLAEPADRVEVVEGAGRRRARGRDDGHDRAARAPAGGRARPRARRRPSGSRATGRRPRCRCRGPARRRPARPRSARARRGGRPAAPRRPPPSRRSGSAAARAARSAVKVASVPPEVNVPPAPGPSPARSHIQRTTRVSRIVPTGDISQTATDWFSAATSDSVQTAAGSGAETWCPIERGWQRWFESGTTSRRSRSSDLLERAAGQRERLVEPAGELVRAERRRDAALAGPRRGEVVDGDPGEGLGDGRLGVLLEVGEDGVGTRFHAASGPCAGRSARQDGITDPRPRPPARDPRPMAARRASAEEPGSAGGCEAGPRPGRAGRPARRDGSASRAGLRGWRSPRRDRPRARGHGPGPRPGTLRGRPPGRSA